MGPNFELGMLVRVRFVIGMHYLIIIAIDNISRGVYGVHQRFFFLNYIIDSTSLHI